MTATRTTAPASRPRPTTTNRPADRDAPSSADRIDAPPTRARPSKPPENRRGGRVEHALAATLPIVLGIGVFLVAFVHVHDVARWAGQPDWAAWLIAVSVELMALASIIEIRHRHRIGTKIGWPIATLVTGIGMSGAANLAAASSTALHGDAGFWTPTMALWPVVAFGLVAGLKATRPAHPSRPAVEFPSDEVKRSRAKRQSATLPPSLIAVGKEVAADLARQERPLTRSTLVREVRRRGRACSTDRAALLLAAVRTADTPTMTADPEGTNNVSR